MTIRSRFAVVLVVSAVIGFAPIASADQPSAVNVDKGKRLYMANACYFCHGTVGQGLAVNGARIGPPSRAVAGFIAFVRRPSGAMPAYTDKILSDADLTEIYAFLRSMPTAKAAKEIPLLGPLKGK
jgi:ubiquinol-cytochrome c reductase cytochrome c subunit